MSEDFVNDNGDGDRDESPAMSVKDLIPGSRLAAAYGGDSLRASDPTVCDGDDVLEVNLTTADDNGDRHNQTSVGRTEPWMSPDTERAFFEYIVGGHPSDVDNLIAYVKENHWFGGHKVCLSLDVGKTILNRSMKLVLHNNSKSHSTLSYYDTNTSKYSKPLKKTDFVLKDWPHVSFNQPSIPKKNEDELPPWIRQRNKKFNAQLKSTENPAHRTPIHQHQFSLQQPYQRQYQYQQLQQQQYQYQQQQQQQYQYRQQQYQYQQQQQYQYHQQYQYRQQYQYQQQQQQYQYQQQQRNNIFIPSSLSPHQILMFGRPPIMPYLTNFPPRLQQWPGNNYHQRFSIPLPLPTTHCYWNPINTNLRSATIQHDKIIPGDNYLLQHSTQNDVWIDKMLSTIETNNKNKLRRFLLLLKNVYPKRIEEFMKVVSMMDYLNSYPK